MAVAPGALGMKHMANGDISAMGKGQQIAEPEAHEASKTGSGLLSPSASDEPRLCGAGHQDMVSEHLPGFRKE